MINLSRREGIPQVGPNIFRLCLTTQQQAKAIVKLSMDTLGYKRFAVLYPNMSVGLEFVNAFWDEVEARGGEIRGAESYDHDQTTFTVPVKKLVGRYWIEARTDYLKAVADIHKNHALTQMQRQHQQEAVLKSLPPITDFDAIFIPDNAKEVGYIAPALAFEDIIVSTDTEELKRIAKTTGRDDIKPIRLLGGNGWNSPRTVERGGKFVEGAVFVDGFFLNDPEPRVQRFVKLFRDTLRSDPSLPDAQAFDAAGIIAQGLALHPADRAALERWLSQLNGYSGVTGKIGFDKDGEAQRDLYILTIDHGQIVKYEPKASG
jgi:ABC-type branched-subunit amino acid transport system substrate-binding protein